MKTYLKLMNDAFGIRFITLLFIVQCLLKGVIFITYTAGVFPLLKSLGIDAVKVQLYGALAMSPWTVKPLMGIVSDLVAFWGYHKRFWMLFSVLVGMGGTVGLVVGLTDPVLIVVMLTLVHFEIAVSDLLVEGKYAELMREHPETGSNIVTLANGFQQVGVLIAMAYIGPIADALAFRISDIIALVLASTPILPLLLGFMPESQRENAPVILLDTLRLRRQWKIVMVVALAGLSAPAVAAISALAIEWLGLLCSLIVLVLASLGGFYAFDHPIIWRVLLYQVLTQVSRISFSSALDFFFTANEACLPGGPQFSYEFYITFTGIASGVASVLSVGFYQLVFSGWRYRSVLIFTTLLSCLGGIFDFVIVKRWNLSMGIPDPVFFLIGDDIIHSAVNILNWIPSSSIIGKVCPENMESSTYAFIAGISNFATMVSVILGALLTEWFGVVTVGGKRNARSAFLFPPKLGGGGVFSFHSAPRSGAEWNENLLGLSPDSLQVSLFRSTAGDTCEWAALPWLILFGHILFMLIVSLPACFLIPNVPQDANLLEGGEESVILTENAIGLQNINFGFEEEDDLDPIFT